MLLIYTQLMFHSLHYSYAKALIGLDEPAKAKAALEEALEIEPNDSEVLRVYNEVYLHLVVSYGTHVLLSSTSFIGF